MIRRTEYWYTFDKNYSAQKMKFSIKDFFIKLGQIRWKLRIWSHLLKKSLTENFIFCALWKCQCIKYFWFYLLLCRRIEVHVCILGNIAWMHKKVVIFFTFCYLFLFTVFNSDIIKDEIRLETYSNLTILRNICQDLQQ